MSTTAVKRFPIHTTTKRTLLLALTVLALVFVAGALLIQNRSRPLAPPPSYERIAERDLASGPYDGETVAQFTLTDTADVGVFFTIEDLDSTYFDLSLIGPEDEHIDMLQAVDFRTDRDGGGQWEHSLGPGTYRLVLTAAQSPGCLSI